MKKLIYFNEKLVWRPERWSRKNCTYRILVYEITWLILGPENISTKQRGWDRMPAKFVR